ncbi:MAG: hypothetical protein B7733_14170 [Myxococcales bacterium FL481]|nr:MAG: hypothetical protein B7733_14170 [Myxococcales bacterium FL481]
MNEHANTPRDAAADGARRFVLLAAALALSPSPGCDRQLVSPPDNGSDQADSSGQAEGGSTSTTAETPDDDDTGGADHEGSTDDSGEVPTDSSTSDSQPCDVPLGFECGLPMTWWCESNACGDLELVDAIGCPRTSCEHGEECPPGQVCVHGQELLGACWPSLFNTTLLEDGDCAPLTTGDCSGRWCLPEDAVASVVPN